MRFGKVEPVRQAQGKPVISTRISYGHSRWPRRKADCRTQLSSLARRPLLRAGDSPRARRDSVGYFLALLTSRMGGTSSGALELVGTHPGDAWCRLHRLDNGPALRCSTERVGMGTNAKISSATRPLRLL